MVKIAQSKKVKAHDDLQNRTDKLDSALRAWQAQEDDSFNGVRLSMRKLADKFDVAQQTLSDRIRKKHRPQKEYLETKQKLTVAQEKALVELLQQLDEGAMPAGRAEIEMHAHAILNRAKRGGNQSVGKRWVDQFIARHCSELGARWSSPLDKARSNGLTPLAVEQHFQCVKDTQERYSIDADMDYGFDETPMMLGCGSKQRVFGRRSSGNGKQVKQSHSRRDGNRETLTIGETICADGTVLVPTVIYRAKSFKRGFGGTKEVNPLGAQCVQIP